ncbi:MAG: Fic family protein [Cyclobacteriaceae bacterium]|nr:Fic family protein [Cyclobacteriaceae bacterium]
MGKITPSKVQEIIFASSEKKESKRITALRKEKLIRKIAPRIYTSNLEEEPAVIIKRNWYSILANLFPNALLSHRSALEFKPTPQGHIYLTYSYSSNVLLPGLSVHLLKGSGPIEGDNPFFENLFASQEARAFLENLQETRKKGEASKSLPISEIEEKLDTIIRARGEKGLNTLRDKAREISTGLEMQKEFKKLNQLISDLLATGKSKNLTSPVAVARSLGEPFDPTRIQLFERLYEALAGKVFSEHKALGSLSNYKTVAFFEGYFSNYIEGTKFTVGEAKEIIRTETPLPARDEDSHDILGTYRIVSSKKEMSVCPGTATEFLDLMRNRHAVLLQSRTSKKPGEFKNRNNRAGNTEFVDWTLVNGTLKKGFEWYALLRDPFAKAVYMMFLVSEVHPFLDGNGRIARVMMNAELSSKGLSKIIIPTVYREDYMGALRKLTRQQMAEPYIHMMTRAYEFSSTLVQSSIDEMEQYLEMCDAFKEPTEGKLKWMGAQ